MTAIFLIIWFYIYAGLLFAMGSRAEGLFDGLHWALQALLWPVLSLTAIYKGIRWAVSRRDAAPSE